MQTSCPAHFDPFRPFPHVGHGVGQPTDPHFDPHQKIKIRNKKALKTEVFKAFWSCYPDLNRRPHPYQINGHLWEGRYSPKVNGKRMARNVYATTEAECEAKLAELIREMKAEIAALQTQSKAS